MHLAALSIIDVLKRTGGRGKLEDEYAGKQKCPYVSAVKFPYLDQFPDVCLCAVTPLNPLDTCAARMEAYKHSHAVAEESLTRARHEFNRTSR